MINRFVLNPDRGKLMGVAAGLSDYFQVDVLLVRLGLIVAALATGPIAVVVYLLTGWLAADDR